MSPAVRNRFTPFNLKVIDCKIAVFDVNVLKSWDSDSKFHNLLHGISRYAAHNLNCTEVVSTDLTSGDVGDHGNYSGAIGRMQRGEVDYTWTWLRSDCLKSESLGVLAPVFGANLRIISPILDESANTESIAKIDSDSDRFEPFLDTFHLVDGFSYLAMCATVTALAVLIGIVNQDRTSGRFVDRFFQSLWNIFELMVSQGKEISGKTVLRLVWLLLSIGLFIIIVGLFLNLMSTEKVAQRSPDQVETMSDIIGPKFKGIEPTLITNSYTYALRNLVRNGSEEAKLFQALKRNPKNLCTLTATSKDSSQEKELNSLLEEVKQKTRYILYEEVFWKYYQPLICYTSPEYSKSFHASRNTILGGLLIVPYRKGINEGLRLYLEYRLTNQFELGLPGFDYYHISESISQLTSQWRIGRNESTRCLLGIGDDDQISNIQFQLSHSQSLLWFLFTIMMISAAVTVCEHSYTEVVSTDLTSGDVGDYGNYSGAIGRMQKGEVDYTWTWLRSDCLKSESLGVLAPVFGANLRIISPILDESANTESSAKIDSDSDRFEPFLDTLSLVDGFSYLAMCCTVLALAVLIGIANQDRTSGRFFHRFSQSLWNIFELMVNQGKEISGKTVLQLVWLLLNLGLFIIIVGLFFNLLSTEKVAQRSPDQVETMSDIIGPKFKGVEPTLVTNSYTYALRKFVRDGSEEAKLFQVLRRDPRNLCTLTAMPKDSSQGEKLVSLFEEVKQKARYLLYEEVFWKYFKPLICYTAPEYTNSFHASRKTILDGLLIVPYRKGINEGLRLYLEYRLTNQFELGLPGFDYYHIAESVAQLTSQWHTGRNDSTRCLLGLGDEAQISNIQFQLKHSKSLLWLLSTIIVLSAAVTVCEVLFMKIASSKVAPNRKYFRQRVLQMIRLKTELYSANS
ncbi:hypothetical protein HDE_00991 [Halotydeus destructor]|nr:hypothetical protein HDE_00991 [Halotydeus destructor]